MGTPTPPSSATGLVTPGVSCSFGRCSSTDRDGFGPILGERVKALFHHGGGRRSDLYISKLLRAARGCQQMCIWYVRTTRVFTEPSLRVVRSVPLRDPAATAPRISVGLQDRRDPYLGGRRRRRRRRRHGCGQHPQVAWWGTGVERSGVTGTLAGAFSVAGGRLVG